MRSALSAAITITFGVLVLAGYLIDFPLLTLLRDVFLRYAVILAGVALVVGVMNLVSVHWLKLTSAQEGGGYSFLLILGFGITVLVAGLLGPTNEWALWIYNYIQVPVESSLMALLAVVLVIAAARMLRRRLNWFTLLFMGTALLVLLGTAPIFGVLVPGLHGSNSIRDWIIAVPVTAGGRGLLLGVALGTIAVGLRVLLGAERPYGR